MELLFLWIYNDKNGVFNKQGINFSPEYCFTVNDKEETIELSEDSQWKKRESIFKNETIENVSAIVGKNGSGIIKQVFGQAEKTKDIEKYISELLFLSTTKQF